MSNIIVDGASLTSAADQIDEAVRSLALIGKRIKPLLDTLTSQKGMCSDGVKVKYNDTLATDIDKLCLDLEQVQHTMSELTAVYISEIDGIDRFIY